MMEINGISMKEIIGGDTYYRMWVKANGLPTWIYFKAKEMDAECEYLKRRDNQYFEIEGIISSIDNKARDLKVVYYWDEYKTITELDEESYGYIYEKFESFASKYGHKIPDNGELCLGDAEYEERIPQNIKDEWERLEENSKKDMNDGDKFIYKNCEKQTYKTMNFVEVIECTKDIITNELKDAIQNGTIVIEKGADKLFEIIQSVGKID